jgi:hypothetical protein
MKLRFSLVAALAATLATTCTQWSFAQSRSTSMANRGVRLANNTAASEQLPPSRMVGGQSKAPASMQPMDSGYMPGGYPQSSGGYAYGCDQGYCDSGCCDDYGYGCCGDSCGGCGNGGCLGGLCGGGGQFFVTADYLYVHPSFSEATAYVDQNLATGTETFVPLNFDYNSSYRFGGGWRSCCCGDEIRFMFTRMNSSASDTAFPGDIVPDETSPPPNGQTNIAAGIDAKTYDIECRKTIPLGGCSCDCGDCCGDSCGSCCGNSCPAWDITWSGGLRWGDVDWDRSYIAQDQAGAAVTNANVRMDFQGGGIRTGLEGRRYFFKDGCLSLYGKGDLSLLLGDVNISTVRTAQNPVATNTQNFSTRQIIPVTELEGGVTAQVSRSAAITAGYLFAAWHDLGFRDEHELNLLLPQRYDDGNILGFDGFFARIEFAY